MSLRPLAVFSAMLGAAACSGPGEVRVPPSIVTAPASIMMVSGTSTAIGATVTGVNGAARLEWRSLASGVVTVDPAGATGAIVRAVAVGATSIVVTLVGRPDVADTIPVTVGPAPCVLLGIVVSPAQATIAVGDTVRIRGTYRPCGAPPGADTTLAWTSIHWDVANVDSFGLVSGLKPGIATIRVAARDAPNIVGTATVTVR